MNFPAEHAYPHLRKAADDAIAAGIKGEFYPCKPDIFMETYEPASETSTIPPKLSERYGIWPTDLCFTPEEIRRLEELD